MSLLETLISQRDAAASAYQTFAEPILAENRDLTDDEESRRVELRSTVERIDARIAEVREENERAAKLAEIRSGLPAGDSVVRSEPRTYGEGSAHSYFADLAWAAMPGDAHFRDANERLSAHGREMVRDAVNDSEVRAQVVRKARAHYRGDESRARQFINQVESRAMDTTAASGGSFVTPQYLVEEYAAYRQFGRSFINETNLHPLPDYGMTVYLPAVQNPAGVVAQPSQGNAVNENDPTAGYLSSNLTTEAGQITLSQQLLDRAGPGIQFDRIAFDQLMRSYNSTVDAATITAALSAAGTVTDNDTTGSAITDFYKDVAQAGSQMETAAGTVLSPDHIYVSPTEWNYLGSRVDSQGRPLVVPSYAGVFNAIAAGSSGKPMPEGDTGYEVLGSRIIKDGNIPTVTAGTNPTQTQVIVAHMPEVWVWEGDLVPRTLPQTLAGNLQVLLQVYAYWALIVRYPKAVQQITGARYPASPTF